MEERRNVPKLRFPGFTDPWEQRRLGELGSVVMCKRIYKDQTTERGDVPFFKIGTFGGEPDAFISNELFEKYQELYSFPKVGDILISAAGTIGRTTVYQGERAYFQDSNIVWLDHDDRLDNGFLLQYLNDQTWSSLEGSTLKRLYNKDILDARIALPALDEQQCVGSFFAKLDSLIALHQRELDHVKELKKGLLQKMFPKEGTNVPELRFSGFTDPWEQRRLGEIGSARSGVGFPNAEQGGNEGTPFYKVSDMNLEGNELQLRRANNYVTDEQIERKRWKPINEVPAMFFAKVGAAVLLNRKRLVDEPFLLDNNTMAYSFDRQFWDVAFGRILFDGLDLASLVQVGALPSYNASDVESMKVAVPSKIAEQTKIGALFAKLDSLIALHQRELDHVKELKKGLLQQMFV